VTTEDDRITVDLPPGAVDEDTTVTIQPASGCDAPDGFRLGKTCFCITAVSDGAPITDFGTTITICVHYTDDDVHAAGGDPSLLKLAYYDEAAHEWVVLNTTVDTDTGTACTDVNHLSEWAILASMTGELPPLWLWPVVGLLAALIVVLTGLLVRSVLKRIKTQVDYEQVGTG